MKNLTKIAVLLVVSVIVLEVVYVFISNNVSSSSIAYTKMKKDLARLEESNAILSADLLTYTSFETIAKKAKLIGFVEDKKAVLILDTPHVAIVR